MLFAVLFLAAGLLATGIDYRAYFEGAQFVHFLLGPATSRWRCRSTGNGAWCGVRPGSRCCRSPPAGCSPRPSAYDRHAAAAAPEVVASLAPRSVTTPVAMGIAERIGGLPSLTAALVICSGITGAALGPLVLDLVRVRDMRARGLAIGTAAHGIGTARALSVSAAAGAFSGLAMGLNALASALMLPLLWLAVLG